MIMYGLCDLGKVNHSPWALVDVFSGNNNTYNHGDEMRIKILKIVIICECFLHVLGRILMTLLSFINQISFILPQSWKSY